MEDFNVIRPLLSFWYSFPNLSTCLGYLVKKYSFIECLWYAVALLGTEDTLVKRVFSCPLELKFRIVRQFLLGFSNDNTTYFLCLSFISHFLGCCRREIRSELHIAFWYQRRHMAGFFRQEYFIFVQKLVMAAFPIPSSSQGVHS